MSVWTIPLTIKLISRLVQTAGDQWIDGVRPVPIVLARVGGVPTDATTQYELVSSAISSFKFPFGEPIREEVYSAQEIARINIRRHLQAINHHAGRVEHLIGVALVGKSSENGL
jgi:hypothetical protein